jgi:hypothetical protein
MENDMTPGNIKIKRYMLAEIEDHVEPLTGEVNSTTLAEDAFWALEPGNQTGYIPEKYFDCAFEIAEQYEIKTGVKQGNFRKVSGYINSIPGGSL